MSKLEIHLLDIKPKDLKDSDHGSARERRKMREANKEPVKAHFDHPMTAASIPTYKPPSKKEMAHDTVHSAMRESMRRWVGGEISTSKHRENMRRGMSALKSIPKIREGGY